MIHDHREESEEFEIVITIWSGSVVWHYLEILIQLFHLREIPFNEFRIERRASEKVVTKIDKHGCFFVEEGFKIMWLEQMTLGEII